MRRSPLVIAATVAGTAAVVALDPAPGAGGPVTVATLPETPRTAAPASTGRDRQVTTGRAVSMQYGTVQVQAVVQGGRLVAVRRIQMPAADGRSESISSYAGPQLEQQALQVQSARVDGVSGATYTSDAYRTSLQAALDQARRPAATRHAT